jgi:hypothetical protein
MMTFLLGMWLGCAIGVLIMGILRVTADADARDLDETERHWRR